MNISVNRKHNQNQSNPISDNKYPKGTNKIIVLRIVKQELFIAWPMAWKNTGKVSDVTSGIKLKPIILKAFLPIFKTTGSWLKTDNICVGIHSKNNVPIIIKTIPKRIDKCNVFLQ